MFIDALLRKMEENRERDAIIWRESTHSHGMLLESVRRWADWLEDRDIPPGAVVSLEANTSPVSVSLLLALVERACIVVPLTSSLETQRPAFRDSAETEFVVSVDGEDQVRLMPTGRRASHELLNELRNRRHPGMVLFTSGSTGQSKAALHDMVPLLATIRTPRPVRRMIMLLQFDHIGGMNTLLHCLANASCVITVASMAPDSVCAAVERHRATALPTSPTFLHMLLLGEAYKRHDLSSLELITYGTEAMPECTLRRCRELLPNVRLLQTYGLSELGILRSKSRSSDSLWVKLGGPGFETRIVDGLLEIRARSAMLGYLNAPSPFTPDGWFQTGDAVEGEGEHIRFLGRDSDVINVGGQKVFPVEVEGILQSMEGVEEVVVGTEPNAITGQLVLARVKVRTGESPSDFRKRMRAFCSDKLPRYKIPQKVVLVDRALHGGRFKKRRREGEVSRRSESADV